GAPRILADQHAMAMIAAAKDQAGRLAHAQRQIRRNRRIGAAADAVRAEVFASHGPLSPVELLSPIIGQIDGQNLQKKHARFYLRQKQTAGAGAGGLVWLTVLLLFFLVALAGRGLRDVDRIGSGKAVLEALFQRLFELAPLGLFPVLPRLFLPFMLGKALVRNSHRSLLAVTDRGCREITRKAQPAFPAPSSPAHNSFAPC